MNRVNFAHCSHVIVNVCSEHGTWFDRDELRRIVEFIRAGGLTNARAEEIANLERERGGRCWDMPRRGDFGPTFSPGSNYNYDLWRIGIGAAAVFLRLLLRR